MRPVLVLSMVLAACSAAPVPCSHPTSIDSVVELLIAAAATDFHAHRPPEPVAFRNVRIGHVHMPGTAEQYLLCGQFLPAKPGGGAEWTSFATIKTDPYEQWLGEQADALCLRASVVWYEREDLAPLLQRRWDSMRSMKAIVKGGSG